ncbi:MAG: dihydrolipoyl dehydrogenase [Candidatus Omnitrophica bacterium]|jgi:dihydrolipoamide dehydrogenase|nr:dihydrolipoyl dehydrogenase [Candidatus Omnitrophota bacterium]MDD5079131.1 dihydrolipoyl dehydrogenase [Candidatus Omnitrophota bacterium]
MYDLTVIGAGWAGYNAAIEAQKLGAKVCLIEMALIGGTCLNRGCIPTKALLQSAKVLDTCKKAANFGVDSPSPSADLARIQARKNKIVEQLRQGMLSRINGIDFINKSCVIIDAQTIQAQDQAIKTTAMIIATGSFPVELKSFKFDGSKFLSSDNILNLEVIPKSLLIVGGGVIGCEFASLFSGLGTQVHIVEMMEQLLPGEDKEISRKLELCFKKRSVKVNTATDASALDIGAYEKVLVAVGRRPNLAGLDKLGLEVEKGGIAVNEFLQTSVPGVYAAGDCTAKIMLAHYAAYQGKTAAWNICNPDKLLKADNKVIPGCIFTNPEIASCGMNEEAARKNNIAVTVHKFDFLGSGMARILDETDGFIKIVAEEKNGRIIGGSIIGPRATELISVICTAASSGLSVSQLKRTIMAHPSLSEAINEALDK